MGRTGRWTAILAGALVLAPLWARAAGGEDSDLTEWALEDLMSVEVTSVARRPQPLSDTAAAVFVITGDDLRRSGVTTLAEALRLAPGLQVARIDANKWVVTARGSAGRFSNKLLVLVDGRSVYSPLWSGVFWDVQDALLADVDRIEVIRGPGAALWGANAVNGVVNILTRPAHDTQGSHLEAGTGTEERASGAARYGGPLGDHGHYRVFVKSFDRDGGVAPSGHDGTDGWRQTRGGFRADWAGTGATTVTVQGEGYGGEAGATYLRPSFAAPYAVPSDGQARVSGAHLLTRLTKEGPGGSWLEAQAYWDQTRRRDRLWAEDRDTVDLDLQHRLRVAGLHDLAWGVGYRRTWDDTRGGTLLSWDPEARAVDLWSGFLQGEAGLAPGFVRVVLGSKVEHNDFTGWEWQPNARLLVTPSRRHTLWAAASRAVRTPSRSEEEMTLEGTVFPPGTGGLPLPVQARIQGSAEFHSEELLAWEAGYRLAAADSLYLDLALFRHEYEGLRTFEPTGAPPAVSAPPPGLTAFGRPDNRMEGTACGAEVAAEWRPVTPLRLAAAYSYLELDLRLDSGSTDTGSSLDDRKSPRHQLSLRSSADLPGGVHLDLWLRAVDRLRRGDVGGYAALDVRLAWRAAPGLELSLTGQNLLAGDHLEFPQESFSQIEGQEVEPGVYGKVVWAP